MGNPPRDCNVSDPFNLSLCRVVRRPDSPRMPAMGFFAGPRVAFPRVGAPKVAQLPERSIP